MSFKCETCEDGTFFPQYGVAPHECFYKIGKPIGGSQLLPKEQWPSNFEPDPESNNQCGMWHCPDCGPKFHQGLRVEEGNG